MKSCEGCRWIFEDHVWGEWRKHCRAVPPTAVVRQTTDGLRVECSYPLIPTIRCGLYRMANPFTAIPRTPLPTE